MARQGNREFGGLAVPRRHLEAAAVLLCDHASNAIPKMLDKLGLEDSSLEQHIAYDIGSKKLIHHLSQHLDAPAVLAGYSRLVVDVNRSLEDDSVMPEVSDNTVIPGNRNMSPEHRNARIHQFYTPYRSALDSLIHGFKQKQIVPAFIAIHSFTPEMAGFSRPWHAGVLWDNDPRIPLPLMKICAHIPKGFTSAITNPTREDIWPTIPSTITPRRVGCRMFRSKSVRTWSIPKQARNAGP